MLCAAADRGIWCGSWRRVNKRKGKVAGRRFAHCGKKKAPAADGGRYKRRKSRQTGHRWVNKQGSASQTGVREAIQEGVEMELTLARKDWREE